ncbi:MAG: superoxide dismutase family protein [Cyclobacteriaceae bacterium]|nr:superoxide dismutase family protein [Cyclobacteriaceae bacterium]
MNIKNTLLSFPVRYLLLPIWLISCDKPVERDITLAVAGIYPVSADSIAVIGSTEIGKAVFAQENGVVTLTLNLTNLAPGTKHAVRILTGSCEQPGTFWNQQTSADFCREKSLGRNWVKRFAGDVGNLSVDESGAGSLIIKTDFWSIGTSDAMDITGSLLAVYDLPADFSAECFQGLSPGTGLTIAACGTIDPITMP